jgi:hypothetical protein
LLLFLFSTYIQRYTQFFWKLIVFVTEQVSHSPISSFLSEHEINILKFCNL